VSANLFPEISSKHKPIIRNIDFTRMAVRKDGFDANKANPDYPLIDPEKYKFSKSKQFVIKPLPRNRS
jgi:hypothetical protein